jgi:hypothetical protein
MGGSPTIEGWIMSISCEPQGMEHQPTFNHDTGTLKINGAIEEDHPVEEESSECLVYYLFSHSIFQPIRKNSIRYLQDQAAIEPIRPNPSLEVIADLPSMLFSSLPLSISTWILTSHFWVPLCGLMIWERIGTDVIYKLLSTTLKGLGRVTSFVSGTYENIITINSSSVMTKGARRVLPWVDGHIDDEGALGSLLYPHCRSS